MTSKVVSLIGSQCDVVCSFNDKTVTVLWDTGAQVSLVNTSWWKENFSKEEFFLSVSLFTLFTVIHSPITFSIYVPYSDGWKKRD